MIFYVVKNLLYSVMLTSNFILRPIIKNSYSKMSVEFQLRIQGSIANSLLQLLRRRSFTMKLLHSPRIKTTRRRGRLGYVSNTRPLMLSLLKFSAKQRKQDYLGRPLYTDESIITSSFRHELISSYDICRRVKPRTMMRTKTELTWILLKQ